VWFKDQFGTNSKYVKEQVEEKSANDPFWHQVGLLYEQLDGISQGEKVL
jgi:hypothetical protein